MTKDLPSKLEKYDFVYIVLTCDVISVFYFSLVEQKYLQN